MSDKRKDETVREFERWFRAQAHRPSFSYDIVENLVNELARLLLRKDELKSQLSTALSEKSAYREALEEIAYFDFTDGEQLKSSAVVMTAMHDIACQALDLKPEEKMKDSEKVTILPDGSGFAVMSMPLPKDHWLTQEGYNVPPMPYRLGKGDPIRKKLTDMLQEAGKYAVRSATMNGKETDFDPDALIQNLIVGFLGYHTADGLSSDKWSNPKDTMTHGLVIMEKPEDRAVTREELAKEIEAAWECCDAEWSDLEKDLFISNAILSHFTVTKRGEE